MTDFTLSEIVRTGDQEVCITEIRDDGTCRVESTRDGHTWTTQLNYLEKIQWPMWVNVYELDRCYGGPEEGGWYYNAGTLVCSVPVFHWGEEVMEVARLEHHYPETGRYCDVNYSGGDFRVRLEPAPGASWPEEVPSYE